MFWLMCFFAYVCMFWLFPLTHNETVDYFDVVIRVHIIIPLTVMFVGSFGYFAHRLINSWIL
jgi:hypothetical protein